MAETPHPLTDPITIEEIVENFDLLDDWDDRYGYLIELGKLLRPLAEDEMSRDNRVQGCVSQVWLVSERVGDRFVFRGGSDAHIVRGLVAIALTLFNGKTADEIVATDEASVFAAIGLDEHISGQRANGLRALVNRIREEAR